MKDFRFCKNNFTDKLSSLGVPKREIWLCECTTKEEFIHMYGTETEKELNTDNCDYVVYYHSNGVPEAVAFFNTIEEYKSSCKFLADYLK